MASLSCSVLGSTRHRAHFLARCLEHLVALDHPSYEIIVVDNSDGEQQVREQARRFDARYLHELTPGISRARNTGARMAEGDIVAFVDDGAVADPDWLRAHEHALRDSTVIATTGRVLPATLATQASRAHAGKGGDDLGPVWFRVDRRTPGWFEMANFGGVGLGGNLALRRSVFASGWGFREDIGLGAGPPGEEHYAFFELLLAGHGIAYVPDAVVLHEPPANLEALRRRTWRTLQGSSAYSVMLLAEEPEFRRATLAYGVTGLLGRRRSWRTSVGSERFAGRGELLAAAPAGPSLYLHTRAPAAARRTARTARRRVLGTLQSPGEPYASSGSRPDPGQRPLVRFLP